jgi:hypothetical protein
MAGTGPRERRPCRPKLWNGPRTRTRGGGLSTMRRSMAARRASKPARWSAAGRLMIDPADARPAQPAVLVAQRHPV